MLSYVYKNRGKRKGLKYKIRWPIREFKNWQQQRQNAINFIDSLEIKEKEEK
jgi:hypothetical protein